MKNSAPSSEFEDEDKCPSCGSPCDIHTDLDENDECNECGNNIDIQIMLKDESKQETPSGLESVLAKISHVNDLGISQWYEVVYYDNKWCSYNDSKTFEDGERVMEWKYCKDLI